MHIDIAIPNLIYAQNISHRHTESYLIHKHPEYELYYYLSGNATFLVDGREYTLEPHTMLIFPPNVFHGVRVSDDETYVRHTIHFTLDCVQPERRAMLQQVLPRAEKAGACPCLKKNMEGTPVLPLLMQMQACAAQDEQTRERLMPILMEAIIATIALSNSPSETEALAEAADVSSAQETIITYLNAHFTEAITLDDLSERFFISKHHLNRSFRKATGTTVRDYLISKRVTYVQQLLINGVPATQAATLAGFGDYTAFYRAYVKRFGHAPSQDRSHPSPSSITQILNEQIVITPDVYKKKAGRTRLSVLY